MALTTTMARARERADMLKATAKISARQLAVLVNLSPTVLGNAFAGVTYLGSEKETRVAEATLLLLRLEESVRPLRLPENTDQLRKLLDFVKEHDVDPDSIRAAMSSLFGQ
jgi:hypothetical protein